MDALDRKQRLVEAVEASDVARLESLLKEGGKINSIFPNGKTLLIMAIEKQNQQMVDFLIQAGADLHQRDFYDHTPLMYASIQGSLSMTSSLLKAGADANSKNKQGYTALTYASHSKNTELVNLLIEAGAEKPAIKTGRGDFLNRVRKFFLMDEFAELKTPPAFPKSQGNWDLYAGLGLPAILAWFPRWSLLHWLVVAWVVWRLILWFPSSWMIFPLGWEIVQMYMGKSPAKGRNRTQLVQEINAGNDASFVSLLMDLGARELASLHHTHFDKQSLPVQRSIFRSRILSVLLAGSILVLALIFLAYDSAQGIAKNGIDNVKLLPALGLYLFLWLILYWIRKTFGLETKLRVRRLHLVQMDRDRIAGEISQMLDADEFREKELPAEFGLYLRAFMTTDKLHIKGFDFETMLAYSIAPTLPLLALGKPGEHLGAGRIRTTDEHWQDEILRLMKAARLIFIIPSYRRGTLWEISTLREQGYFSKTIFIMPPELNFHGGLYSKDWQETVAAARKDGLEFPFHIRSGAFFRLNRDGEFEDYAPCLPEEFMKELDLELPWQAEAGGSLEAAVVESSGMAAVTSTIHHGYEAHPSHALDPFHAIDSALGSEHAAAGGHDAGSESWDHSGDDGSDAGYHAW